MPSTRPQQGYADPRTRSREIAAERHALGVEHGVASCWLLLGALALANVISTVMMLSSF